MGSAPRRQLLHVPPGADKSDVDSIGQLRESSKIVTCDFLRFFNFISVYGPISTTSCPSDHMFSANR